MITSIYETLFDQLLLGKPIKVPTNAININSIRVQWTRYKANPLVASLLEGKVISFNPDPTEDALILSITSSPRRRTIPFTVMQVEPTHEANSSAPVPNNLEPDQTG